MKTTHRFTIFFIAFLVAVESVFLLKPECFGAQGYALLKGCWQCQEEGVRTTLEFRSKTQLVYNGQPAAYQLIPDAFRVLENTGPVDYFYQYLEKTLVIYSLDGSVTYCQKAQECPHQEQPSTVAPNTSNAWPEYERPSRPMTGNESDLQSLVYKFAGRWDNATTNTLTNLYLKPDGTYEESYEAGYSGQFHDQGGYQTGHWGATGNQQGQGRWTIQGTLKRGSLTLTAADGSRTVYQYQVHYKNGEYFWGEYFFNGKLFSVTYIYR